MNRIAAFLRKPASRRAYAELMQLDDRLLSDIGLTRFQVDLMAQGKRLGNGRSQFGA